MSDHENNIRTRLRDEYPFYAKNCLQIRSKSGAIQPFVFNTAQLHIHKQVELQRMRQGYVRAIILKGRQQGCCFSPEMKVLNNKYQWIKLADIKIGDELFSIDENVNTLRCNQKGHDRKIRKAIVEAKIHLKKEAFEVALSNGNKLIVTGQHRMLFKVRGGSQAEWRQINKAQIGDEIRAFCNMPKSELRDFEDGWFGGLLDGEGSIGSYETSNPRLAISQVNGYVLERAKLYLRNNNIHYYELIDRRKSGTSSKLGNKEVHCLRIDRRSDMIKVLTKTQPIRLINKDVFIGKSLPNTNATFDAWVKIESIKSIGEIEVIDLQTDAKTYICEGLVSHNSTYIEGRFYWRVTFRFGVRAFILTHEQEATKNLYEMAQRYHQHCPVGVKPHTGISNANELYFDRLDSGYRLGTAGNKSTGRSATIQYLHGSEAAFWENAGEHAKGIMQTVPSEKDTEIFIESTANGIGNYFHEQWQKAESGLSDFIPIFVPWFWQDEYRRSIPKDFKATEEEEEIARLYSLTPEQVNWRRYKIVDLSVGGIDGTKAFCQEYPCSAIEAFQTTGEDSFIQPQMVMVARKNDCAAFGPLLVGVDPARFGDDRTCIIRRRGRVAFGLEIYTKKDTMEIAGFVHGIITKEHPDRVFIDIGGLGAGVYDRLKELGHSGIIVSCNSGSSPLDQSRYVNRRSEMWGCMREWLLDVPCQIPDSDELHADLCGIKYKFDSKTRLVMGKKEDMKKRGVRSPDASDALALTFWLPEDALYSVANKSDERVAATIMSNYNRVNQLKKSAYR